MRIDLHTHSLASDGTDTPSALIEKAAAAGLDVVGLTDHDTAEGWAEAAVAAERVGITLIRGMEVSTNYRGQGVHLLAYLPDPADPALREGLAKVLDGRNARVPAILARLREQGITIDIHDVRRVAGQTEAAGRPHIADALVELKVVKDRTQAFKEFLNPGRPAYVKRYAADLEEMLQIAGAAGAVCVIAHPWGRHGVGVLTPEAIADLAGRGVAGLEVDHQDHDARQRLELRGLADELDLMVTGSSDHHGLGKIDHDLGCNLTAPETYERLVAACEVAGTAARERGRTPPTILEH